MKKLVLISFVTYLSFSCNTSTDLDFCAEFDKKDFKMLNLIEVIRNKHASDAEFINKFDDAQVYWIQYRDRTLRALYPKDWSLHYRAEYGKEVFNACKCKELLRMTELRVDELELWNIGNPKNQSDCPSSRN